jgi:hypothetical protein
VEVDDFSTGKAEINGLARRYGTDKVFLQLITIRAAMKNEEERELRMELERLRQEHRDLDTAIDALLSASGYDRLQVQRLKKRKLQIRDQISEAEDKLFPDIIA